MPSQLAEHELRFVGYSQTWGGGVATVHPHPQKTVPGLIYRLSPGDFERLDVHESGYKREIIQVPDQDGRPISVQTYLHLQPEQHCAPSPPYAAIIAHAYGQMGIDFAELNEALNVPTNP